LTGFGSQLKSVGRLTHNIAEAAEKYFDDGPFFKPIRERPLVSSETVFGTVGWSTSSQAGEFNGINSQVFHEGSGAVVTTEWCFVSLNGIFTTPGDPGSVILKSPVSVAFCAFWYDLMAYSSCSSLEMLWSCAHSLTKITTQSPLSWEAVKLPKSEM
jgi:hypothetical protein